MIDPARFHRNAQALSEALHSRLGVSGRDLGTRLARAGRLLPRALRRDSRQIAQAGRMIGHPKLARLVDTARTDQAFARLGAHLKGIDPAERRRQALLSRLAVVVFNLMVLGAGLLALLAWRGLL